MSPDNELKFRARGGVSRSLRLDPGDQAHVSDLAAYWECSDRAALRLALTVAHKLLIRTTTIQGRGDQLSGPPRTRGTFRRHAPVMNNDKNTTRSF